MELRPRLVCHLHEEKPHIYKLINSVQCLFVFDGIDLRIF